MKPQPEGPQRIAAVKQHCCGHRVSWSDGLRELDHWGCLCHFEPCKRRCSAASTIVTSLCSLDYALGHCRRRGQDMGLPLKSGSPRLCTGCTFAFNSFVALGIFRRTACRRSPVRQSIPDESCKSSCFSRPMPPASSNLEASVLRPPD